VLSEIDSSRHFAAALDGEVSGDLPRQLEVPLRAALAGSSQLGENRLALPTAARAAQSALRLGRRPAGLCYSESTVVGSIERWPPLWATSILRGLARSASGMVTVRTPFSYVAVMAEASTPSPSESCLR
jgi:hypothetical protein